MLKGRRRRKEAWAPERSWSGDGPPRGSVSFYVDCDVVVPARVGKEFPDMRQNERRIKLIRVGDAVRTAGQFKGEPTLNGGGSLVHFYSESTRSGIGVLRAIC